jgi:hypothetical protein
MNTVSFTVTRALTVLLMPVLSDLTKIDAFPPTTQEAPCASIEIPGVECVLDDHQRGDLHVHSLVMCVPLEEVLAVMVMSPVCIQLASRN